MLIEDQVSGKQATLCHIICQFCLCGGDTHKQTQPSIHVVQKQQNGPMNWRVTAGCGPVQTSNLY